MEQRPTSSPSRARRIVSTTITVAVVLVALGVPTLVLVHLAAGGDVGATVALALMALLAVLCAFAVRQERRGRGRAV